MWKLAEARARALEAVAPLPCERLPLLRAHRRYLAEDVRADRDLPGCDNSAMDGFAVRAADVAQATRDRPAVLALTEVLYAGSAPRLAVSPGQAARIFTGAPLPDGADAVVRQEAGHLEGAVARVFAAVDPGANVRRLGEELGRGEVALCRGARLDSGALALVAALGRAEVLVGASPRVAVLTLGDELVPLGGPAAPHQVYESNGVMIAALCAEAGGEVRRLLRAQDADEDIRAELGRAAEAADLIITAGGASVGDRDRIKHVLRGALVVDGVALKPGKPVAVGMLAGKPVVVLPGNPGAAAAAFDQFARPLLLKLQGVLEERRQVEVRLDAARHKQAGLTYLLAARRSRRDGEEWAEIPRQGAGQIAQNVGSEGWVVLPPGQADFRAGDRVTMELFSGATTRPA